MSSTIQAWVRRYFPEEILYTTTEAANEVGRSAFTLRRWERDHDVGPSRREKMGKTEIRLYTMEDITKLREFAKTQRPGRKRNGETSS